MKSETIDYLTFFICCKLQAEALESASFFLLKDLSVNNEKNVLSIVYSLQFLSDIGAINNPKFSLNRIYDSNSVDNMIIETATDPIELARFGLIDHVNCGYFLSVKDKEFLNKLILEYVEKFKADALGSSPDGYLIQREKIESLILKKYKTHKSKRIKLPLKSIETVDLLPVLQSLKLENKINILDFVNHRKYWHDGLGDDPTTRIINRIHRQGRRYDSDLIEVEFEISNKWQAEIEKKILLENFVMELKYFDGRIWIEVGDRKIHLAKMHFGNNNDELFKFITSKKPKELIEIKSDNLDTSKPQVDPIKKLLGKKDIKKYLDNIGFDATIRAPFFYDIGKESLKFTGFKITGKHMQEMGIDPEEYLKALENIKPKEELDEEANLASTAKS